MIAVTDGNLEIAKLLIENGAIIDAPYYKHSPLQIALLRDFEIAVLLLENGADINKVFVVPTRAPVRYLYASQFKEHYRLVFIPAIKESHSFLIENDMLLVSNGIK